MKTLKSFVSYAKDTAPYGRVYANCIYHDSKNSSAIYTNGHFMIISKDCYKEEFKDDCERFYKMPPTDWLDFKYEKCIPDNLKEVDFEKFISAINIVCNNIYKENTYKENLNESVYFEDFGFTLSMSIIHVLKLFIDSEKKNTLKFFTTDNITKPMVITSYNFFDEEVNKIVFVPISYSYMNHKIEPNFIVNENNYRDAEDFIIEENKEDTKL